MTVLTPQFVPAGGLVLLSSIALGVIRAAVSGAWFTICAGLVDRGRARITGSRPRKLVEAASGLAMPGRAAWSP